MAFYLVVGLFLGLNNKVYFSYIEKKATLFELMWPEVIYWLIWGAFCPCIIMLAKRYPQPVASWLTKVKFHVPVGIGTSLLHLGIFACLRYAIGLLLAEEFLWTVSQNFMRGLYDFQVPLMMYCSIVGITYAIDYYEQFRDEALKAAKIQQKLAQAELLALKKQLHPHFLFNTLHAISALMHKDIDAADKMIVRLSSLLRATLENTGVQEVALRQEIEILKAYLEIEQIRFQDRLEVSIQVDPELYDKKVPNLILQPIVENAIRHGIAPFTKQGKIVVSAYQVNDCLELRVTDNGKGMPTDQKTESQKGIGLQNTRMRLEQLYGEKGQLVLRNLSQTQGFEVKIVIPA